tara:strand:- start:704 stop:1330 length:627 start_codon:yes stop_codon:yes gene_type:complete
MFNKNLNNISYSAKFQVCFLGDQSSGKTTVMRKIFNKNIPITPTIGVDYDSKITNYGNREIKLSIWDLSGAQRFRPILKNYYNDNDMIVLFLDLTKDVFTSLKYWLDQFKQFLKDDIPILIVLNKSDMVEDFNITPILEETTKYINKYDIIFHNIKIDKYDKQFIEKKIFNLLIDELIEIDLSDNFLPKRPKEKREFCFIAFFKSLWK